MKCVKEIRIAGKIKQASKQVATIVLNITLQDSPEQTYTFAYTAIDVIPNFLHVSMMRHAISPLLAIRRRLMRCLPSGVQMGGATNGLRRSRADMIV